MLFFFNLLLSQGCPGLPEAANKGGQGGTPPAGVCGQGGFSSLIFIILIFAIFYFLFIRPSQQKQKEHHKMIDSLTKGDRVVTQGGIHGRIARIKNDTIKIKIDDKTEIEVEKNMVGRALKKE